MAKGVTENDVHVAAYAVLARGERPTVERIRAHLGTGSPNTVTRWLETWWGAAGARLTAHESRLALPDAPKEVAAVASQLWELALHCARGDAEASLAGERAALAEVRESLANREVAAHTQLRAAEDRTVQALDALRVSETRLADLQRLIETQAAQVQQLQRELDNSQARQVELAGELTQVRAQSEAATLTAAAERDTLLQQLRGSEERAAMEIDRARQDAKRLQVEAKIQVRQQNQERAAARQTSEALEHRLQQAVRHGDMQRARADALEKQLTSLADLPASLEAALSRKRPPAAKEARSTASKHKHPKQRRT